MAKNLLNEKNIEFEERNLGNGWTTEQLWESVPGARSMPQIVLDGKVIGTYQHLKQHFSI
jgi:glutaredoxin